MRVRCGAFLFVIGTLVSGVSPLTAAAEEIYPFMVDEIAFVGVPMVEEMSYGTYQTALKTGDMPTLRVNVQSFLLEPVVSVDLSGLGFESSTTTPADAAGPTHHVVNYIDYYPNYRYDFGPFTIGADVPDGRKTITVTATDTAGITVSTTTSIVVDTVAPTFALSQITFASVLPQQGDPVYLSGSVNGTGSAAIAGTIEETLLDASGRSLPGGYSSAVAKSNAQALTAAFASVTDGTFTKVPIQFFWGGDNGQLEDAVSVKIDIVIYDEAGHIASSTLTALIPKTKADLCTEGNCHSNVLFLPGIEGSRLYEGTGCGKSAEEKLWEPIGESLMKILRGAGDDKVRDLFLDSAGRSVCNDVYAKTDDIIDSVRGSDIYQSFIGEMNGLKTAGTIADWKPVAYDWRLSLDDLLDRGAERGGKIFYTEATSTPYIEQTLRALAESSQTGKVTLVAHSNGGLVAKALLNKLGSLASKSLVDKIIMVGAPQSGAPVAVGALLYGYDQGINYEVKIKGASIVEIPIVSAGVARDLAENAPMAYHLLPSEDYLESTMGDADHPVARFSGDAYANEIATYSATIANRVALDDFLLSSTTLNASLIDYANSTHAALDFWTPPEGIEVHQVAGWGADTVAGIDFYTLPPVKGYESRRPQRKYKPIFTEDGDGTVPAPSALMIAESASVKRYWLDLHSYNKETNSSREHKDLFEIPSVETFIKNIIQNSTSTLPAYILLSQPPSTSDKKLTFFLHSPLTLELTDLSGNVTGLGTDESVSEDIPGSTYGEFGEVKYVTVPSGNYQVALHGQTSGTFSLDIQETLGGVVTNSSTIANVPTTDTTLASLTISGGIDTVSSLVVDQDGDGANIITIAPVIGETVNYEPPVDEPAPTRRSHKGSSTWSPEPAAPMSNSIPVAVASTTESVATTTSPDTLRSVVGLRSASTTEPAATSTQTVIQPVATSTPEIATSTLAVQTKNPSTSLGIKKKSIVSEVTVKTNLVPQTASVYDASSQQPLLTRWGRAVYNGLYGFWTALKKLF